MPHREFIRGSKVHEGLLYRGHVSSGWNSDWARYHARTDTVDIRNFPRSGGVPPVQRPRVNPPTIKSPAMGGLARSAFNFLVTDHL